ncbi:hypothetical protein [Paludibaculum fermentans]|uniref:hypothetical protein n=1 Tax=Paludibaculum fermentans TaxID=1473598 RepID=UPI003EC06E1B
MEVTNPIQKCKALYDDRLNARGVFPALSTGTTGGNDIFFLAGEITDNNGSKMKEKIPPALYGQILFLPDDATGMSGLPKEVWFALAPVSLRNPAYLPKYAMYYGDCTR